jgi:hypothetical protein
MSLNIVGVCTGCDKTYLIDNGVTIKFINGVAKPKCPNCPETVDQPPFDINLLTYGVPAQQVVPNFMVIIIIILLLLLLLLSLLIVDGKYDLAKKSRTADSKEPTLRCCCCHYYY